MLGLGYGHPQWGHGMFVGDDAVDGESWRLSDVDPTIPLHLHVQAVCTATCGPRRGVGVLEQLSGLVGVEAGCLEALLEIAPEHRESIFMPFRTLGGSDGGMGLAIVQRTVKAVGGRISVAANPTPARGTTFTVQWPKTQL